MSQSEISISVHVPPASADFLRRVRAVTGNEQNEAFGRCAAIAALFIDVRRDGQHLPTTTGGRELPHLSIDAMEEMAWSFDPPVRVPLEVDVTTAATLAEVGFQGVQASARSLGEGAAELSFPSLGAPVDDSRPTSDAATWILRIAEGVIDVLRSGESVLIPSKDGYVPIELPLGMDRLPAPRDVGTDIDLRDMGTPDPLHGGGTATLDMGPRPEGGAPFGAGGQERGTARRRRSFPRPSTPPRGRQDTAGPTRSASRRRPNPGDGKGFAI